MIRYRLTNDIGRSQPLNFINYPSAWTYGTRTFMSFGAAASGNDFDLYASYYNHVTRRWASPVKIADALVKDDHGCPNVMVDNNGYIHVFHACGYDNYALKHYKSNMPLNIQSWTAQTNIEGATYDIVWSYPKAVREGDAVWLIYSYSTSSEGTVVRRVYFKKSTDNGANWGASQLIIENGTAGDTGYGVYPGHVEKHGSKIHMTWIYVSNEDATYPTRHVYYAYLNTNDSHMYDINNTDLGTSITYSEANSNCKIVDSGTDGVGLHALHVDSDGYPWIMYLKGSGITTKSWTYYHTRWDGSAWTTPAAITTTGNSAGGNVLEGRNYQDFIIHSLTEARAFVTVAPGGQRGGDIEEWLWRPNQWTKLHTILSEDDAGAALNSPMVPYNHNDDLELLFTQINVGDYAIALDVYAMVTLTRENKAFYDIIKVVSR